MILWVDAQLSPALAPWIAEQFGIGAYSVKRLGYRDAADRDIFRAARVAGAVVLTKDGDFIRLLERHGPSPQVLLVTLGNTSNAHMRGVLERTWARAVLLLEGGEPLVEIGEMWVCGFPSCTEPNPCTARGRAGWDSLTG